MTCALRNGVGAIVETWTSEDGMSGGSSTKVCECRRNLAPRLGKAHYWTEKAVHTAYLTTPDSLGEFEALINVEQPMSADNFPLVRTAENCYFKPTITLEVDSGPALTADSLRLVARWLLTIADKAAHLKAMLEVEDA